MKQIVNQWCSFCEGTESFENGHFYTLFMGELNSNEIREIYKYFPNAEDLIIRWEKFIEKKNQHIEAPEVTVERLDELIRLDFEDRKSILKEIPEFAIFIYQHDFIYISDYKALSEIMLDDIWSQAFCDYTDSRTIICDKKTDFIYDALYGIATDFDMRRYLFRPLLELDYSANHVFDFKNLGGNYAITENGVYFTRGTPQI